MSDLISRKAAIEAVLSEERYCERNMGSEATAVVQMARFKLEKVPVVDAVPVVRCRDCKHFIDMSGTSYPSYCYKHSTFDADGEFDNAFSVEPNKYCAWGERRESE